MACDMSRVELLLRRMIPLTKRLFWAQVSVPIRLVNTLVMTNFKAMTLTTHRTVGASRHPVNDVVPDKQP